MIDTNFDQGKKIITKDLDNWHSNFWRLRCHEQVRTPNFTNPKFQFPQFKVLQSVFFSFWYKNKQNQRIIKKITQLKWPKYIKNANVTDHSKNKNTLQHFKLGKLKFGIRKIGCSMSWTRYKFWNQVLLSYQGGLHVF